MTVQLMPNIILGHIWPSNVHLHRKLPYRSMEDDSEVDFRLSQYVHSRINTNRSDDSSSHDQFFYTHPNNVSRVRRIGETVGTMVYITSLQVLVLTSDRLLDYILISGLENSLESRHRMVIGIVLNQIRKQSTLINLRLSGEAIDRLIKILLLEVLRISSYAYFGGINFNIKLLSCLGIQMGFLANVFSELTEEQSNRKVTKIAYAILCALPLIISNSNWFAIGVNAFVGYTYLNQFGRRDIIDCKTIINISRYTTVGCIDSFQSLPTFITTLPTFVSSDLWIRDRTHPLRDGTHHLLDDYLNTCIKWGGNLAEDSFKKKSPVNKCISMTAKTSQFCLKILKVPVRLVNGYLNWRSSTNG